MRLFLLCCVLLGGCLSSGDKELVLGAEYAPLRAIRERGAALDVVVHSDSAITTVGEYAYVKSLYAFTERRVPGTPTFRAIMLHEREHSRSQLDYGVVKWLHRYVYDKEFALEEEKRGYYYEIRTLLDNGITVNPHGVASQLSSYSNLGGALISFDDALAWAEEVISGRWKPDGGR